MSDHQQGHNAPQPPPERVGVILVHGVGEQRRFQHLDGEIRKIIDALRREAKAAPGAQIDVEIAGATSSQFLAEQDTWQSGEFPSVIVTVHGLSVRRVQLCIHEVWWADVNEPYTLSKQFRFWSWGLAIWRYPAKRGTGLAGAHDVVSPIPAHEDRSRAIGRLQLFLVGMVFAAFGVTVGIATVLLKRLFDIETPAILQTVTNYVSGVKLYNQRERYGTGMIPESDDFLDTIEEPPRVSIRRRMIRTVAGVALQDYSRWYVLAHSQGTVVAFNGLMESAWAWPGYFTQEQWQRLLDRRLAGPPRPGWQVRTGVSVPRRPIWSGVEVAYRPRIFSAFRGLLTYGSPLEKYVAIWPARVPISREGAFHPDAAWVNAFDPMDPISGVLRSFSVQPHQCCPHPQNVGFKASWILLLAHLKYLTPRAGGDIAGPVAHWLLGTRGPPGSRGNGFGPRQFAGGDSVFDLRRAVAWAYWIVAFLVLLGLSGGMFAVLTGGDPVAGAWHLLQTFWDRVRNVIVEH